MISVAPLTGSELAFGLHGLEVTVRCPFPEVVTALRRRFSELSARSTGRGDLVFEYRLSEPHEIPEDARLVYESEHGTALYDQVGDEFYARYGQGVTLRCAPVQGRAEIAVPPAEARSTWLLSRPMFTLALMECAKRRGLFPLHAACLAREGRGVVIAGPSGAGKSTLALALARAGFDFLGDDLVFLAGTGGDLRLLAFPDELGLTAGASSSFPDLRGTLDQPPSPGWPKLRVPLVEATTPRIAMQARPSLLLLARVADASESALKPVDADGALLALLPNILLTERSACDAHLSALDDLVRAARCLHCETGRDLEALGGRIADLLDNQEMPERM